jgi:hypothetical protein
METSTSSDFRVQREESSGSVLLFFHFYS